MDSVQRRRETQYVTPMDEQLTRAVDLRIESEEEFKKQLVFSLRELIKTLSECDPSNARTTLDLTQQQLAIIVSKLNDKRAISSGEATRIANTLKESNLFRGPTISPSPDALPQPPASLQSPTLPPAPPGQAVPTSPALPPAPQAQTQPARKLPTRTMLNPVSGGRRTRRRRKTRR